MTSKKHFGSLLVASLLASGNVLASGLEPVPPHDTGSIPNREGELVPATLDDVFIDPVRHDNETQVDDSFLPDLPILVDGRKYTAEELRAADIHLAHYVLDARSAELQVVQGFRTSEDLKNYLHATNQFPSLQPRGAQQFNCNPYSVFFEHAGYGGASFSVYPGWTYNTLGSFWNDRISSIWGTQCGSWTLAGEHTYFGGYWLWIGRAWAVYNLSPWGWYTGVWPFRRWHSWNDRISSVRVYW
jgi:hypothetical protein